MHPIVAGDHTKASLVPCYRLKGGPAATLHDVCKSPVTSMPTRRGDLVQGYGTLHPATTAALPGWPSACSYTKADDLTSRLALRQLKAAIRRPSFGRRVAYAHQIPPIAQCVLAWAVNYVDGVATRAAVLAAAGRSHCRRDDFDARLGTRGRRTLLGDSRQSAGEGRFPGRDRCLEEGTVLFGVRLRILSGDREDELRGNTIPELPRESLHLRATDSCFGWKREGWGSGRVGDAGLGSTVTVCRVPPRAAGATGLLG